MKHFVYKTSSKSGRFYIGRHSTNNINDGYCGSGKWVNGIKDKSELSVEILEYADSIETLLILEEQYINRVINHPDNMNFNNRSAGWAAGHLNPTKKGCVRSKEAVCKNRATINEKYADMSDIEKKQKFGHVGEKNGFFNKKHSAVTKKQMRETIASTQDRHLNNPNAKPVTISGVTYPLMKSAMVALGINRKQLIKLLGEA